MIKCNRMFVIDAHIDLAMNAMEWNRDLTESIKGIRAREKGQVDKPDRGNGTVSLPELRRAEIGIVVATQIARYVKPGGVLKGWNSPQQAWAQTQGQLAWYKTMEDMGEMTQIVDWDTFSAHLALWQDDSMPKENKAIGYILSLEGADSLVNLSYLEKAYSYGLRAIGPAHYGPGRYAPGTGMEGPLTNLGKELLREMDNLNLILDVTHLTDEGFWQAIDIFKGPIWASHHNCRALVNHQRQLTDEQIRALIDRDAVIGGVLDAWMLTNDWVIGVTQPHTARTRLEHLIDHYDHICQLAGNANHIAIGSDLDGGYGVEQTPTDLNTIADLQSLNSLLRKRGYAESEVENVFHGNWLRFLRNAWEDK